MLTGIKLNSSHYWLAAGESFATKVTGTYNDGTPQTDITAQATYSSSNPTVASVDSSGIVQALAEGEATINVSSGNYHASAKVNVAQITGEENQTVVFQSFEELNTSKWILLSQGVGKSSLSISPEQSHGGTKSLKLDYNFSQSGSAELAGFTAANWSTGIRFPGNPDTIGIWVYGDNSGYSLELDLKDASNEVYQYGRNAVTINWTGWKFVRFVIASPSGKYGGDGVQDKPMNFFQIFVTKASTMENKQSAIYFDDIELIYNDVTAGMSGIKLNANRYWLAAGETFDTQVTVQYTDGSPPLDITAQASYSSSDPAVATVDASGKVTAVGDGAAIINVSFEHFEASAKVNAVQVTGANDQKVIYQSFEDPDELTKWILLPQGAGKSSLTITSEQANTGTRSLKISYDFNQPAQELTGFIAANWNTGLRLPGDPDKIGVWVYGDASGYSLELNLKDSGKEVYSYGKNVVKIDWSGWKYLQFAIDKPTGHYGGDGNHVQERPIYFFQILFAKNAAANKQGAIYFDDIQLIFNASSNDDDIAGGIGNGGDYSPPAVPVLTTVSLPAPRMDAPQPSQLNNENELTPIAVRRSADITDSLNGLALTKSNNFFFNTPDVKSPEWGSFWLIDGDFNNELMNTAFSSMLHTTADANEWVQVEMNAVRPVNKVVLKPRIRLGLGFPIDFQIQTSLDGEVWSTVVSESGYGPVDDGTPQIFQFPVTEALYVRVNATKLKSEGGAYYFQLQEMEIYLDNSINYAYYGNGGEAKAANPLGGDVFDYTTFYDNMFGAGAKWLLVADGIFYGKYREGKLTELPESLLDNVQYIRDNGIQLIFRFQQMPSIDELKEDETYYITQYAEFCGWTAARLKGKVNVWAIANEQNFGDRRRYGIETFPAVYSRLVKAAAAQIKSADPGTPIEIETALFDFGWTEDIFAEGLADVVDIMAVHVYKERVRAEVTPEAVGTFIQEGVRHFPNEQPYADYAGEVEAYKQLLNSHNPDLKLWITETSVNTGDGAYDVTLLSQAKFLARLYLYHYMIGVGTTNWWSLDAVKTGITEWGLIDLNGQRKPAWFALRNISGYFDYSLTRLDPGNNLVISGDVPKLTYGAFENSAGDLYIPYWCAVPMSDANTGKTVEIRLNNTYAVQIEAVDMLTGTKQTVHYTEEAGTIVLPEMIIRDYPIVVLVGTDKEPPVTSLLLIPDPPDGNNGWYISAPTIAFDASDSQSGPASTVYSLDNGASWLNYTTPFSIGTDGEHVLTYRSTDNAGNVELQKTAVIRIDMTPPTATVAYSRTKPTGRSVVATITPSENVTVTNNGGSLSYTFYSNGSFTFEFTDDAGNSGTATAKVNNIRPKDNCIKSRLNNWLAKWRGTK
ncbi:discoidin domain-containing protein [Paenibacillus sp. sptzw28]|uniref:OmpL47-type beta-barrel domain-containing protein n=1 Tax=Paenibacillus sp. sptzw28 TaxID=715179 RepID=UPI001C6EC7A9|nr:discoidin domain-containing protein [Paenibacillus sp. sptzw28]QYR23760.1 discoidin domain-containing protein [Paenibacillus sp. sptzw28]